MVGNPAEVILVRMCTDSVRPAAKRMGYPDALRGLGRIAREEGVVIFGRGLVLMSVDQIAP